MALTFQDRKASDQARASKRISFLVLLPTSVLALCRNANRASASQLVYLPSVISYTPLFFLTSIKFSSVTSTFRLIKFKIPSMGVSSIANYSRSNYGKLIFQPFFFFLSQGGMEFKKYLSLKSYHLKNYGARYKNLE